MCLYWNAFGNEFKRDWPLLVNYCLIISYDILSERWNWKWKHLDQKLFHTVKSTVRRMNTPVLIYFSTWVHTIFSCLWTVLLFLTWLYTRFWLYMMQKHPYCEKYSLLLPTWPVIRFSTIYDRLSLTYESRMTILSLTLNRIESRHFISEKIGV